MKKVQKGEVKEVWNEGFSEGFNQFWKKCPNESWDQFWHEMKKNFEDKFGNEFHNKRLKWNVKTALKWHLEYFEMSFVMRFKFGEEFWIQLDMCVWKNFEVIVEMNYKMNFKMSFVRNCEYTIQWQKGFGLVLIFPDYLE